MKLYYQRLKVFYSNLILENISNFDYKHANKLCNTFNVTNLGHYYNLYVRSE